MGLAPARPVNAQSRHAGTGPRGAQWREGPGTHDDPRLGLPGNQLILSSVGRRGVQELGVDSATIAVATGPAAWLPAYASAASAGQLEQYAFTVGEGPCIDTLRDHAPIVLDDLSLPAAIQRWPAWTG